MHGRIAIICLVFLAGCVEHSTPETPALDATSAAPAPSYDVSTTGTIEGRVTWDGDVPSARETVVRVISFNPYFHEKPVRFVTPHVPVVQPNSGGVANAVVYLKGIDPTRARPWDHSRARVEFRDRKLHVDQGGKQSPVGFVQRGSAVEFVNRDAEYHNLRVRGAAFFGLPLIEANKRHERKLPETGVVDLTCAAGHYWLHAHLFVLDHPYIARTDANGRFTLDRVPAGTYEVVCWMPNWRVVDAERDPETAVVARWIWAAPGEERQTVRVETGKVSNVAYSWSQANFAGKGRSALPKE